MSPPAGSGPGSTPGERLRAERERRGFSTQKVAEDLHLDVWVVEALESGSHESLGAPVFVKGHLRKYALLLGLDADELVLASGEQTDPPLVMLTPKARTRPKRRLPVKAVLTALLVIALLAIAVLGYRYWRERGSQAPAMPAVEQPGSAPTGKGVVAVVDDEARLETASAGGEAVRARGEPGPNEVAPAVPARPSVRVRLSFSADSWVELYDANQKRVFFDMGTANSARAFTLAAPARVFLGYADGVQLEVDGQPVTIAAEVRRNNVAHFTIDAGGRLTPAGTLSRR